MERTSEELVLLGFEGRQSLWYYKFKQSALAGAISKAEVHIDVLMGHVAALAAHLQPNGPPLAAAVPASCALDARHERARVHLLKRLLHDVDALHKEASTAFAAFI